MPRQFTFRDVPCASMEGLLQSLKFPDPEHQKYVCTLTGHNARQAGFKTDWRPAQLLFWQGEAIDRHSEEYQRLIDEAYRDLFIQNQDAAIALLDTGYVKLDHSIGNTDPRETILTKNEFLMRLKFIREILRATRFVEL